MRWIWVKSNKNWFFVFHSRWSWKRKKDLTTNISRRCPFISCAWHHESASLILRLFLFRFYPTTFEYWAGHRPINSLNKSILPVIRFKWVLAVETWATTDNKFPSPFVIIFVLIQLHRIIWFHCILFTLQENGGQSKGFLLCLCDRPDSFVYLHSGV